MNLQLLAQLFGFNDYCIKKNTEGLTHADSLVQPHPDGNCLNWVVGHIVATRNLILSLLGESAIWSDEEAESYKRGSKPIQDGDAARSLEKILADFNRSQELIINALKRMKETDLATKIDEETLGQKLAGLYFHETYHIGQTGLLRRLAGKKGAIK
ncbi:MAG: DinB family protein [bacterium]